MPLFFIRDNNYTEKQISDLTQYDFTISNLKSMPLSLFKYYPNSVTNDENGNKRNYSLEALQNNTVFLQSPINFDDPYDCNIFVEEQTFALERIKYYSLLCGVDVKPEWKYEDISYNLSMKIYNHISAGNLLESIYEPDKDNELVNLHQQRFFNTLKIELMSPDVNEESYFKAFNKVIKCEYQDIQQTANSFRISCFTQTPFSMLMWAHYAKYHQGFCIEYEVPTYPDEFMDIFHSLFPVIYTDTRTNLTDISLNWKSTGVRSKESLWDFYKYGLLIKSLEWKYQQEWRLVSYDNSLSADSNNCNFFKIKKVYLGNKMSKDDRLQIIKICKDKGIPYSGITISLDKFEMKECNILCEDCYKLK